MEDIEPEIYDLMKKVMETHNPKELYQLQALLSGGTSLRHHIVANAVVNCMTEPVETTS